MSRVRHTIRGDREFDRSRNRAYPAHPSFKVQHHAPVSSAAIRGPYRIAVALEAPAVVWGPGGGHWCFLHDLDAAALQRILWQCREAVLDRGLYVDPHDGGWR